MKPPNDLKRCQDILLALTDPAMRDSGMTPEQIRWCGRVFRVVKQLFFVPGPKGTWVMPRGVGRRITGVKRRA